MQITSTQQYETQKFINENQQQQLKEIYHNKNKNSSPSSSSGSSDGSSDGTSSLSSTSSVNKRKIAQQYKEKFQNKNSNNNGASSSNYSTRKYEQMPHYWPADRVPYIGISYCQLFQYLFAFLFISVLIWIFFGLKHFGENNNQDTLLSGSDQTKSQNPHSNLLPSPSQLPKQPQSFAQQLQLQQKSQPLAPKKEKTKADDNQQQKRKQLEQLLRQQTGQYQRKRSSRHQEMDIDLSRINQHRKGGNQE